MESSSNHMACLLKIESSTKKWDKSLEKLFNTINDVNFTIDKRSKTVHVYGKIDQQKILEKITKAGENAEVIWSGNNGCKKPMENRKDHFMEQCFNNPASINAPNGYHQQQQQCHYPQPNWMNQYQPYPLQTFALPPPYTRQLHPQPPPPPYVFHQNEPVAKSFPPTPPPPKNFTMGDLQSGLCRIM